MPQIHDESTLRAAFAPARALEPGEAEVAAALARAERGARRRGIAPSWQRLVAPGLAVLAVLVATAYAVPPTRAALESVAGDVAGIFDGWAGKDSVDAPGRALRPHEPAPGYFRDGAWARRHVNDPRVIAEAGGYKLFAYRERSGSIGFDLGDTGVGMGGYHASDFAGRALCLLGPGSMQRPDQQGHLPWFGVASPTTRTVELTYASGPPLRLNRVKGGFVLLTEPSRGPREITAYDAAGNPLGRATLGGVSTGC
jgi:hypothetical protein